MFNLFKSKKLNTRLKRTTTVMYRHGDLLIRKINAMPPTAFPIPKQKTHNFPTGSTLAEGEISGHKHQLIGNGQVYVGMDYIRRARIPEAASLAHSINDINELWFKAEDDLEIVHEEHKTLEIPKGIYKVTKEQEFNPFKEMNEKILD